MKDVTPSTPNGPGRPAHIQDDERTRKMVCGALQAHCTEYEVAAFLVVSYQCWYNFKKRNPEYQELVDQQRNLGKAALRRMQFKKAMVDEDKTMLIFLGKQYLGQSDKTEGAGGSKNYVQVNIDKLQIMTDEELNVLESALGKLGHTIDAGEGEGGASET